ncbi:hypothetical protein Halru_1003 [Halovivax ruber XH-70]|uniref:Uncharacterized protein n=1 Tax=Halovivax ruber (strain DSM 18193 / JCM 13892 / XH-70) TaxID=797302 RepID=L0ICC8_HALRX|nr:hypothetical protein Halru_1003 [Halovivax ruber XH-70]
MNELDAESETTKPSGFLPSCSGSSLASHCILVDLKYPYADMPSGHTIHIH